MMDDVEIMAMTSLFLNLNFYLLYSSNCPSSHVRTIFFLINSLYSGEPLSIILKSKTSFNLS